MHIHNSIHAQLKNWGVYLALSFFLTVLYDKQYNAISDDEAMVSDFIFELFQMHQELNQLLHLH